MGRKRRPNIHKKLLSALLALAMVAGVPAPAFALDAAPALPETAVTEPLESEAEIMEQILADAIAAGEEEQPGDAAETAHDEQTSEVEQPALPAAGDPPWYEPDDCVKIIFDTDIDSDVDDAGAMALLHAYAQQGRAELLAMVCCAYGPYCAPCVDAINTYYGLPDIPVGTDRSDEFKSPTSRYNQFVAQTYANDTYNGYYAPDAVDVYRETLAGQPDNSVVLVVVGTLNNLEALLQSEPDEYSDLTGMELVEQKVKLVSCMAGIFPSGKEHNIQFACRSAQYVAENCPAPIMFSGWEIGSKIKTGGLRKEMEEDNPVRKSYDLYCGVGGTRESWDLTSVVYAVEGLADYWDMETGRIIVNDDGSNGWEADEAGAHARLIEKMAPSDVTRAIDELMISAQKDFSDEPYSEVVDNADPRVEISGGFKASGAQNPQRYNKTAYFGNTVGATITFPFTGIGIEAFGGRQFEHGKAEVYIDGQLDQVIDTYQKDEVVSTLIYKSGVLEDGDHTFTLKIIEELSEAGSDRYTDLDYFRVIQASEPPPLPPKPKPEPALVAHWTFDEKTADGKIPDVTGNGHDGVLSGGPALAEGKLGNSIRFSADGQLMTVADADDLDFAGDDSFTLSTWVKVEALTSDWQTFVQKGRTTNETWYCLGLSNPAKSFNFGAHGGNNVTDGKHVTLDEWVLMTAVQDGDAGTRTLYLDGKAVKSGPASGSVTDRTMTFGGVDSKRPENFRGRLDDFRIYNYALSQDEIDALFETKPVDPTDPDLLAHWTFDSAEGGKVIDVTGNGHDGVIQGSPEFVQGKVDNAIRFSADGQRVVVSNTADFDFAASDSFTITSWLKAKQLSSGWQAVMQKGRPTGNVWYGIWMGGGKYTFGALNGNVFGPAPRGDHWQHVTVVQEGESGTRCIYIDGALAGSGKAMNGATPGSDFTIGGVDEEFKEFFRGQVDDVAIYKRALTEAEVAALYEAGEAQNPEPADPEPVQWTGAWPQAGEETANVIFDTDIGPDVDDAGAMAVLHTLADLGEVNILATLCDTSSVKGAQCLDALNTYYGRPDIPVGVLKEEGFLVGSSYNGYVADNYPHDLTGEIPDAVKVFRETLAVQPDGSVTVIGVGPLKNLANLLKSGPDEISELTGVELVAKKVKLTSIMGGAFPSGSEWNFQQDPAAAQYVAAYWPTPIMYSGFEIGAAVMTGSRRTELPEDHPVRKSYDLYCGVGNLRQSWDLTSVLYGVRGLDEYWDMKRGDVSVDLSAANSFVENNETGARAYLTPKMAPAAVAAVLDALMVGDTGSGGETEYIYFNDPRVVQDGFNLDSTNLWGNRVGSTITLTFQATNVEMYGTYDITHGKAKITIDGEQVAVIDTYGQRVGPVKIFGIDGLENREHVMVVEIIEEKNEASSDRYLDLYYFKVVHSESEEQADKSMLRALIAAIDGKYDPERFTAESYAALTAALDAAIAVEANPAATQQQVYDAYLALVKARDGLAYAADDSLLRLALELAEEALADGNLTGSSRAALENAVTRAEALLAGSPDQEAVNAAYKEVMLALTALTQQADREDLKNLIALVEGFREEDYKPSGWPDFAAALAGAIAVRDDADATAAQIQQAHDALMAALNAMQRRANFAALESAYSFALDLSGKPGYDVSSLAELMAKAEAMIAAQEADQADVDALAAELTIGAARVRLTKAVADARTLRAADYTTASWSLLTAALNAAETALGDSAADAQTLCEQEAALQAALSSLTPAAKPGGSSKGSAAKASDSDLWDAVAEKIASASQGDTIGVALDGSSGMPATVLDAAREKGVNFSIAVDGRETLLKAGSMKSDPAAVYYSAAELIAMAGGAAPETGTAANTNPETGGEQATVLPQTAEPAALAEPGAPIVIGPEAARPAEPAYEKASGHSAGTIATTFALLAAAAAVVILLRRSQRGR